MRWTAVLPVKRLDRAKSRLRGLEPSLRAAVALAMASDTVSAVMATPGVTTVVVVTDDPTAARCLTAGGARVVPDEPGAGINAALVHGAKHARRLSPGAGLLLLTADLPCLRPDDLAQVLSRADAPLTMVADVAGTGTTLLLARPGIDPEPRFGARSRAAHRMDGAVEVSAPPSVRRDVDTEVDLWDARRIGVGAETSAVLGHR